MQNNTTFYEILRENAVKYVDRTAILYDTFAVTYEKLFDDAVKKAMHLQRFEGKRIAIYGPSSYRWIVNMFGTIMAGKDAILVDFFLPKDVRKTLLNKVGADYILCSTNQYILSDSDAIIIEHAENDDVDGLEYNTHTKEGNMLFFTATDTESDNAVVLTVDNIMNTVRGLSRFCKCDENDKVLSQINLDHVFGFIYTLIWPLASGACVCVGRGLRHIDADTYYYNPTILPGNPSIIEYLKKIKGFNQELKTIITGGATCPARLMESLKDRELEVINVYGMTETASSFAINRSADGSFEPIDEGAVTISDDGEILVSGLSVMQGYDKDKAATEKVLRDGVLHTGEKGYFNEDGHLVITQHNPNIILLPTGEKICRAVTINEIDELSGIKESYIELLDDKLTAIIVPMDKNQHEDKFKRLIDKYNEKKGYRWEIQKIIVRHEALPKDENGEIDAAAINSIIC